MGLEEELLRIAKKLEKMVARKKTEGALDLLKKLNSCQMSIQLLQTTRIGVAVNGVRKHCSDKEVVSLAKALIKNWKRLLVSKVPQGCPLKVLCGETMPVFDFSDSPRTSKGERKGRDKAKKKEKGLGCSDWKPKAALPPPKKKRQGEPQTRYFFPGLERRGPRVPCPPAAAV
ncbi:hypothetical protein STEG23_025277 [Scotinomys teguina]